jgi:hypothetical protein
MERTSARTASRWRRVSLGKSWARGHELLVHQEVGQGGAAGPARGHPRRLGLGRKLHPLEEVAYGDAQGLRQRQKARRADPVRAAFVLLDLLKPHAHPLAQVGLAHPLGGAERPDALTHEDVDTIHETHSPTGRPNHAAFHGI